MKELTNEQLRTICKKRNISQVQISRDLDVNKQQVNAWFRDKNKISRIWQRLLRQYFDDDVK